MAKKITTAFVHSTFEYRAAIFTTPRAGIKTEIVIPKTKAVRMKII